MEVKRRKKSLAGLFLKYIALFCITSVLLAVGELLFLIGIADLGLMLPANYAEVQLAENTQQISQSETDVERWIPEGCTYGVYSGEGIALAGSFSGREQKDAWEHYKKGSVYSQDKEYYRFISMDNGNVCIIKYTLVMRYSNWKLNDILPPPELLGVILYVILFVLNIIFLSRGFAGKLKKELRELSGITKKIAENDLAFETRDSDIKEIDEVMASLGQMKEALQDSLEKQWDMEQQRRQQLSALAHDIKTPLTIIKGNAELLEEGDLEEADRECVSYILTNVKEIEHYLDTMRQVLHGTKQFGKAALTDCGHLAEIFAGTAKQLAAAKKLPVSVAVCPAEGNVLCVEDDILRAWSNIVSNAAEHTDRQRGISVSIGRDFREDRAYLVVVVRDYGEGFSRKDLQYADREFYSGDASRHDRKHQGLGLAIARRFVEEQGGFLEYQNSREGKGAEVALWLKLE